MDPAELAGMIIGLLLTLMVFSYLIGDNPLFRVALSLFIGVAAGFAVVSVIYNIFLYQLIWPAVAGPVSGQPLDWQALLLALPPLLLGLWLLVFKSSPRLARLGNPVMAYLAGAAAATAIGGAILGTLFPQVGATAGVVDMDLAPEGGLNRLVFLLKGLVLLLGTVATLVYFHYGAKQAPGQPIHRRAVIQRVSWVGMVFIAITLGVVFAGVYTASLSALIDRVRYLYESILAFIG